MEELLEFIQAIIALIKGKAKEGDAADNSREAPSAQAEKAEGEHLRNILDQAKAKARSGELQKAPALSEEGKEVLKDARETFRHLQEPDAREGAVPEKNFAFDEKQLQELGFNPQEIQWLNGIFSGDFSRVIDLSLQEEKTAAEPKPERETAEPAKDKGKTLKDFVKKDKTASMTEKNVMGKQLKTNEEVEKELIDLVEKAEALEKEGAKTPEKEDKEAKTTPVTSKKEAKKQEKALYKEIEKNLKETNRMVKDFDKREKAAELKEKWEATKKSLSTSQAKRVHGKMTSEDKSAYKQMSSEEKRSMIDKYRTPAGAKETSTPGAVNKLRQPISLKELGEEAGVKEVPAAKKADKEITLQKSKGPKTK